MAWTLVKCIKCDNEYKVQMYGPVKAREWKSLNWNGVCDDCKEAAKMDLDKQNKSGDLPELTGSNKQVAWAMNIRENFIEYTKKNLDEYEIEDIIQDCKDGHKIVANQALIDAAVGHLLDQASAHWWIDVARNELESMLIASAIAEIHKSIPANDLERHLQADVEAEAVMRPAEKPLSETIADISLQSGHIKISFPERRDSFREIVKTAGYRWNQPWEKRLSFSTENPADRVAEIGHNLLAAGFCIRIMDPNIRKKIINLDFSWEHTRWISVLTNKPKHFYAHWAYDDNMYNEAKKITGSRYSKPGIIVPMEHIDEVLDFAEIYKFKFSPTAKKLIEKAKINKTTALIVDLKKKKKKELPVNNGIPTLEIPKNETINDEFMDKQL